MPVYSFQGMIPVVATSTFVHPTAVLIGDVIVGAGCYIGPGVSLRGDMGRIVVGEEANIQDNCVAHSFPGKDLLIEDLAHIGHGAIIHGCHVGRNSLIGMNAVIMDGAVVGEDAFVGAMSFVRADFQVPPRTLALGLPARVVRPLTEAELAWKIAGTDEYRELARLSLASLRECEALTEVEPNRPKLEGGMLPLNELKAKG
jgi:phenylacetic acid degradation protein